MHVSFKLNSSINHITVQMTEHAILGKFSAYYRHQVNNAGFLPCKYLFLNQQVEFSPEIQSTDIHTSLSRPCGSAAGWAVTFHRTCDSVWIQTTLFYTQSLDTEAPMNKKEKYNMYNFVAPGMTKYLRRAMSDGLWRAVSHGEAQVIWDLGDYFISRYSKHDNRLKSIP